MSDRLFGPFNLRPLGGKKEVCVLVASNWRCYRTHYASRTMLCPGEGCVACRDSLARDVCVSWGWVDREPGLIVMSAAGASAVSRAIESRRREVAGGLVEVLLRRPSVRRPWVVEGTRVGSAPTEHGTPEEGDIVRAIGRLIGIPRRFWRDDFAEMLRESQDWARSAIEREWAKVMLF